MPTFPAAYRSGCTSPGARVMVWLITLISSATPKTISEVEESCTTSPLRVHRIPSCCGSGTSSAVTSTGPIGRKPSIAFPRVHCPPERCRSRADRSLAHSSRRRARAHRPRTSGWPPPDHHAELGLPVRLRRCGRDRDPGAVADHRVRELREQHRLGRDRFPCLGGVVAVVQTDADDLAGAGTGREGE